MREGDLLMRVMAAHVDEAHAPADSSTLRERAEELQRQADTLRQMITSRVAPVHADSATCHVCVITHGTSGINHGRCET
jgi:hypothetical protein